MSTGALFAVGVLVSIVVATGLALPIIGAILDGRYQADHEAAEVRELSEKRDGRRPAA